MSERIPEFSMRQEKETQPLSPAETVEAFVTMVTQANGKREKAHELMESFKHEHPDKHITGADVLVNYFGTERETTDTVEHMLTALEDATFFDDRVSATDRRLYLETLFREFADIMNK